MDATKSARKTALKKRVKHRKSAAQQHRNRANTMKKLPDQENADLCRSILARLDISQVNWAKIAEEQNLQEARTARARWENDQATTTANQSIGFYYSIIQQLGDSRIEWKKIAEERGIVSPGAARGRWGKIKERFESKSETEREETSSSSEDTEMADSNDSNDALEEIGDQESESGMLRKQSPNLLLRVLQEMGELRRESKEELEKTRRELQQAREVIKNLSEKVDKLESTLSTQGSGPARSYAEAASPSAMLTPSVAITPPNSRPSLRSLSPTSNSIGTTNGTRTNTTRTNAKAAHATPEVLLDMRSTQWNGRDTAQLVQLINAAMHDTEGLEGRNCRGIKTRWLGKVALILGDEDTVQKMYAKEPWKKIRELGICNATAGTPGTFKVKGIQVPTEVFESENVGTKMKEQEVENMARENETKIREIRKLTPTSTWGETQVVILCDTEKEQRSMLEKGGITMGGRWIPVTEFFESKRPRQCFRCWKLGHFAAVCRDEERCLRCGEPGHKVGNCANDPRYINCLGAHAANDKKCRPRNMPGQTTDQSQ